MKIIKNQTFEEYLQKQHFEENQQILDDDLTDAFNDWKDNADIEDIIEYAQKWGDKLID